MDDVQVRLFKRGEIVKVILEFTAEFETEDSYTVPVSEFMTLDQARLLRDQLTAALEEAETS